MPGKEVGHDTDRSLVMQMGVSLSELPGNVRGEVASIVKVRCWRADGSPELFVGNGRATRRAVGSSAGS
jgi:hypothetical protein